MKHDTLPVQLGHNLHKGIVGFPDRKHGGYSVLIVWLKKECKSGEDFAVSDIYKINDHIHFCDIESLETTIDVLNRLLREWKGKEE